MTTVTSARSGSDGWSAPCAEAGKGGIKCGSKIERIGVCLTAKMTTSRHSHDLIAANNLHTRPPSSILRCTATRINQHGSIVGRWVGELPKACTGCDREGYLNLRCITMNTVIVRG